MGLAAVTSVLVSNTFQLCNVNTGSTNMTVVSGDAKQKTFNQIALKETLFTFTFYVVEKIKVAKGLCP